jgi:hypothetical protein
LSGHPGDALAAKTVAVVVSLSDREGLTSDEETSLRHLVHFLGKYDKYFVAPKGVKVPHPGFEVKRFPGRFFGSPAANGRLMLSATFYSAFRDYKYVLVHHLDALVLEDRLEEWCATGLDYIAPPWLKCDDSPWVDVPRVGNGGFSLRKVDSHLKVIHSRRFQEPPDQYWERFASGKPPRVRYANVWRKYLKRLRMFNGARWQMRRSGANEDYFWSDQATHFYPEFKVASFQEGLRFAFEVAPRLCFELNGGRLPFGCHAWPRYDRAFWEPYLLVSTT